MLIYSYVLLASTVIPIRITRALGLSNSLLEELNYTATDPAFADDLGDSSTNRLTNAYEAVEDEERVTPKGPALLRGPIKTVLFKLYRGASKNLLTPKSRHRVTTADEMVLKRVNKLSAKYEKIMKAILSGESEKMDVDSLRLFAQASEEWHRVNTIKTKKDDITKWMRGKPPEQLVQVLKQHKFFRYVCYANVNALRYYLEEFNAAHKTEYMLLSTLSEGFGGVAKFARILAIAKQSPITGDQAQLLQDELLSSWRKDGESIDDIARLLGLRRLCRKVIRYENLDTFVGYVALVTGKPTDAISTTLTYLRRTSSDIDVVRAIIRGKKAKVLSATSYLRDRYKDVNIELEEKEHEKYATQFEKELVDQWVREEKDLDWVHDLLEKVPLKGNRPHLTIEPDDTSDILMRFEALHAMEQ